MVISIFADAAMISSIIVGRETFTEDSVRYIYKKQLEEADILVLNKTDLVDTKDRDMLDNVVRMEYPGKAILHQNSLGEGDIAQWIEELYSFLNAGQRKSLDIDYDVYAAGEAKLAWLDKTVKIIDEGKNAHWLTEKMIISLTKQIHSRQLAIGHLKFFIESNGNKQKVSITPTTMPSDIKLAHIDSTETTILINARVETDPSILEKIVGQSITQLCERYGCRVEEGNWSVFKPGFPRPTYRILT